MCNYGDFSGIQYSRGADMNIVGGSIVRQLDLGLDRRFGGRTLRGNWRFNSLADRSPFLSIASQVITPMSDEVIYVSTKTETDKYGTPRS